MVSKNMSNGSIWNQLGCISLAVQDVLVYKYEGRLPTSESVLWGRIKIVLSTQSSIVKIWGS